MVAKSSIANLELAQNARELNRNADANLKSLVFLIIGEVKRGASLDQKQTYVTFGINIDFQ